MKKKSSKKTSKSNSTKLKNNKIFLNYIIPITVTIFITFCIFIFFPKTAWISATGSPNSMEINNFKGRVDLNVSSIQSENKLNGYILNQNAVNLTLNNEDYILNPGELVIKYGDGSVYNHWDSILSTATIQLDMLEMNLDELNIEKKSLIHEYDNLSKYNVLSIKDTDALEFRGIIYDKEFSWDIQGNCEIYIRGIKIQSDNPFYHLKFTQKSDSYTYMQFEGFNDSNYLIHSEHGKILFTGESNKIHVSFENGNLDFNPTVNGKEFILKNKTLELSPINTEKLELAYTTIDQQILDIQGNIEAGLLNGNSLFLNFKQWIIDNISIIIGTLITTLLGLIIFQKK